MTSLSTFPILANDMHLAEIRAIIGYKCIPYKRKYTVVFLESDDELIICEFLPSKNIYW